MTTITKTAALPAILASIFLASACATLGKAYVKNYELDSELVRNVGAPMIR